MFTTKGTSDKPVSNYVRPGINDNVVIDAVTGSEDSAPTPFVEFAFRLDGAPEANTTKQRIYLSEAALQKSLVKIKHIATKFVDESVIDGITASTPSEYANEIAKLVVGKNPIRMKFTGEQYKNASGELKTKAGLGLPPFAELMSITPTKLKYDENSQWDFKKLPVADNEAVSADNDPLPF